MARPLTCAGALPATPAATAAAEVLRDGQPTAGPNSAGAGRGFIVEQYAAGRSLRQLAELTDRSFSAVRNILSKHGVHRRGSGAEWLRGPSA